MRQSQQEVQRSRRFKHGPLKRANNHSNSRLRILLVRVSSSSSLKNPVDVQSVCQSITEAKTYAINVREEARIIINESTQLINFTHSSSRGFGVLGFWG